MCSFPNSCRSVVLWSEKIERLAAGSYRLAARSSIQIFSDQVLQTCSYPEWSTIKCIYKIPQQLNLCMGYVTQVTIKACGHLENYFHSIVLNFYEFLLVNAYSSKQRMNSFNCPIYLLIKMQKLLMKIVILNILQLVFLWGIKRE